MEHFLCCEGKYEDESYIWFSAYTHNGIYRINKRTQKVKLIGRIPGEKGYKARQYKVVISLNDWMIFVPLSAKEIAILNCKNNKIKKISLKKIPDKRKRQYIEDCKFWTGIAYKNYVYLFGLSYPAIIRLEPDTEEMEYYVEWIDKIEKKIENIKEIYFFVEGIIRGNDVYLPFCCTNAVLIFNLENKTTKIVEINSKVKGFCGIVDDGENLWLAPEKNQDQNIIKWNPDSGKIKVIPVSYTNPKAKIASLLIIENIIYLFSNKTEDVYVIDCKTEIVKKHERLSNMLHVEKKRYVLDYELVLALGYHIDGFTYINGRDYSWHTYNYKTDSETILYYKADEEECRNIEWLYKISCDGILIEDDFFSFPLFLKYLNQEKESKEIFESRSRIGTLICKKMSIKKTGEKKSNEME